MSNRKRLTDVLRALDHVDAELSAIAAAAPHGSASFVLGQSRKLTRAARKMALEGLTHALDVRPSPLTPDEVRAYLAKVPVTTVSISPGALRLGLRRPADDAGCVDAGIAAAMIAEGWLQNVYGYFLRPGSTQRPSARPFSRAEDGGLCL